MAVIRDDVFSLLENNRDVPVGKCASLKEMKQSKPNLQRFIK